MTTAMHDIEPPFSMADQLHGMFASPCGLSPRSFSFFCLYHSPVQKDGLVSLETHDNVCKWFMGYVQTTYVLVGG